jgi:hypothetical protein
MAASEASPTISLSSIETSLEVSSLKRRRNQHFRRKAFFTVRAQEAGF